MVATVGFRPIGHGFGACRIRSVIPLGDLDDEVYQAAI
jgi:hypothetical protein